MKRTVNILLADDHVLLRRGLCLLIESEDGLNVVGEANDGLEAIAMVSELEPDIVIMDINMPNLDGAEATRQICAESPNSRILALSIHSGKYYVESMLDAGAVGYLLKQCAPAELIGAINAISEGRAYLSPSISDVILSSFKEGTQPGDALTATTPDSVAQRQPSEKDGSIISRPHLIEKLRQWQEKKLTLVAALDGYGKTTLIGDWLDTIDNPVIWLTLERKDNDLRLFLEKLLVSVHTLFPETFEDLQSLLQAANRPPVSALANALVNGLQRCSQHFVAVFDNFHLIDDKSINDLLSKLLKQPLPQVHLVLLTCRDPFLPLPSLRANNEINEIRTDDLRFSLQEITLFLERVLNRSIDMQTASDWRERTEGCVASLQLAKTSDQLPGGKDNNTGEEFRSGSEMNEGLSDWRVLLTNREYEVLLLLQQRMSDQEIADQMHISLETTKTHTKNIRTKLDVNSRRAAVSKAILLNYLPAK